MPEPVDSSPKPGRLAKQPSRRDAWGAGTAGDAGSAFLDPAVHRLGLLSGLLAVVIAFEAGLSIVIQHLSGDHPDPTQQLWDTIGAGLSIVLSLGLFAAIRTRALPTRGLLQLGIACWIALAFVVSFGDHADYFWKDGHRLHGIPSVCILIVIAPFIFPVSTKAIALTGLAMASASPAGLWAVSRVLGYQAPTFPTYLDVFIPAVLAALVALIPARVLQRMGAEVLEARRLGSYVLEERLGQGGMGEVWRARHRLLARQAAVKLIRPSALGESSTVMERFGREAQATASLRSPHTVALYDYGTSDDGHLYYAMELLDGLDLESLVRRYGAQPATRVLPWLLQICHSLHEAHVSGLVHRDIKPANVFVCRYGADDDFIKVLDFGIVALRGESLAGDPQLTADGTICGTPAYMAPEMVRGGETVDGRADIYALGCVTYWLLTGRPVFEGRSPVEVIAGHLERRPTPPSQVSPDPVPPDLEALVLTCLEKSPDDRPASIDQLRQRLEALHIPDAWTKERATEWWDAHRPEKAESTADRTGSSSAELDSLSIRDTPAQPFSVRRDESR